MESMRLRSHDELGPRMSHFFDDPALTKVVFSLSSFSRQEQGGMKAWARAFLKKFGMRTR